MAYYKKEFSNYLEISDESRVGILEKYKDKILPLINLVPKKSLSSVPEDPSPMFTIFLGEIFSKKHPICKKLFDLASNYPKMDLQEFQNATVEFTHNISNYIGNFFEYKNGLFKLSKGNLQKYLDSFLDPPL